MQTWLASSPTFDSMRCERNRFVDSKASFFISTLAISPREQENSRVGAAWHRLQSVFCTHHIFRFPFLPLSSGVDSPDFQQSLILEWNTGGGSWPVLLHPRQLLSRWTQVARRYLYTLLPLQRVYDCHEMDG